MEKQHKNQSNLFAKECMVTALMQLVNEKPLSEISVSELTRQAGVSRMTYYRNYSKKEDIFSSYLNDILTDYRQASSQAPEQGTYYDLTNLTHCFSYFQKHFDFIRCLFQSGQGRMFLTAFNDYLLDTWYKPGDSVKQYYTIQAFAGSLYNVYLAWSLREIKESPEELAAILHSIFTP